MRYIPTVGWTVTFFSPRVEAGILALPDGLVARFIRYAERMEVYGPDLGLPHTRAMSDGLFELRIKAAEGIAQIFYCTVGGRRIVLLHHFVKKTEKTPSRHLHIARQRLKDLRNA